MNASSRLGWVVEKDDVNWLDHAVREAARILTRTDLHRAIDTHYDRPLATARYLRVFDEVVAHGC